MSLHPHVYVNLLGEKIKKHRVNCWLINTGWFDGSYGVGKRMDIAHDLANVTFKQHPIFNIGAPRSCPGVLAEVLNPEQTWAYMTAYEAKAHRLAGHFHKNFEKFQNDVSEDVRNAGPVRL